MLEHGTVSIKDVNKFTYPISLVTSPSYVFESSRGHRTQLGSCKRPDAVLTVFFSACEEGWALGQVGWAGQGRAGWVILPPLQVFKWPPTPTTATAEDARG